MVVVVLVVVVAVIVAAATFRRYVASAGGYGSGDLSSRGSAGVGEARAHA